MMGANDGCPTLATLLFLSLGWETAALDRKQRNHAVRAPGPYPIRFCQKLWNPSTCARALRRWDIGIYGLLWFLAVILSEA